MLLSASGFARIAEVSAYQIAGTASTVTPCVVTSAI